MLHILLRNIVSNWVGFAVNTVVVFFLTPFVLHSLGETRYGIWTLVTGLTGYFGLLDLGLRSGTTQYLARHLARQNFVEMNRVASTSTFALATIGTLMAVASLALSLASPYFFRIPDDAVSEVRTVLCVVGITAGIECCFFAYSAVFAATQRYDLANAITITLRLLTCAATVAALKAGYGLLGLCVVNAAGNLIGYGLRWRVAYSVLPQLQVSVRLSSWRTLWEMLSFGMGNVLIQCAQTLKSYSSSVIIALFLPIAALAPFSISASLATHFEQVFSPMSIVFFPVATHFDATGDRAGLREIYFRGSKLFLLLAVVGGLIGAFWATDFFRLWLGAEMVDDGEQTSIVVLFWFLLVANVVAIGQKLGIQILLGCRRVPTLASLAVAETLLFLTMVVLLIAPYGLLGVALGTLVAALIIQGIAFPLLVCADLGESPWTYFRNAYTRPCLVGAVCLVPYWWIHRWIPVGDSWSKLVLCGLLASGVGLFLALAVGLDLYERSRLITGPLRRLGALVGLEQSAEPR